MSATELAGAGLITSGPAQVVGLTDRGRLSPGMRADLVLADLRGANPIVHWVGRRTTRRRGHSATVVLLTALR
nr:hypothetical protein [Haloactinopolyspora sp.]